MANPGLSIELATQAVELVEERLRLGDRPKNFPGPGRSAVEVSGEIALERGWVGSKNAFQSRLETARDRFGLEPDWQLYRPHRYQQPIPRHVVEAAPAMSVPEPAGRGERVLAIGDLHQDPRHPDRLEVLTWIARYASEHKIPRIVQVGDWSTWDSVSSHDRNDTYAARHKPGIRDDLDNLKQSLQAWRRGIDYRPKQTFLMGNHENRLERFENANPESVQTFTLNRDELFAQFGWATRRYGEMFYVEGVGFTHHPINSAGRAYGGKTGPQRAANDTTVPVVSGHTHRRQVHDSPKIGPVDAISMVEIGCGLPWGTVEDYAKHSLTGWWYGVCDMRVCGGQITDVSFVSMLTLRDRYTEAGADVRTA